MLKAKIEDNPSANFIFYNIIGQIMKAACLNLSYNLLSLNFDH